MERAALVVIENPLHGGAVVKHDGTGVKILLSMMGVVGGISTFCYFLCALGTQSPEMVIFGVLALIFLGLVSSGTLIYGTGNEPRKPTLGRVLIGLFTLVGIILASGCSLLLAVGVFAFVVCLAGGMRL